MDQPPAAEVRCEAMASQEDDGQALHPSRSMDVRNNAEPEKIHKAAVIEQDSISMYPQGSTDELPKNHQVEHGVTAGNAVDQPEHVAEESHDQSEQEQDGDHHDHVHNVDRDPDDDPDDDEIVQPKTKLNNRPHVLFTDLRKTLGSPLREELKCPICDEKIKSYHRTLTHIPCRWSFHRACLQEWLLSNPGEPVQCPIDRKPLQKKELSKKQCRFLTRTERKIQEAWPRCDCHLWPHLMFDPEEAQHRNHFFLAALPVTSDANTRMGVIVVAHLIDCARFGLFFNTPGFDGLIDIWHNLFFKRALPPHPHAGETLFDMVIAIAIPVYLDHAKVKEVAAGRFRRLEAMKNQLAGLRERMGGDRVVEFVGARNEAIREILAGAEDWDMSLTAVEARQRCGDKRTVKEVTLKEWMRGMRPWWTYG